MSRLSLNSSSLPIGNGHVHVAKTSDLKPKREYSVFSTSTSKFSGTDGSGGSLDPDELFTKHSISEIRFIQQQLRADADAKQEELRLMVGERYRDLLQASSSIISMAESSQRVQRALEDTRDGIVSQELSQSPRRHSSAPGGDAHLHTLQLLAVHVKLLLDSPEHLWRLIERKEFLRASWLFLLARVLYRTLVRQDEQEEGSWNVHGVDVLGQFPLIKRQWDTISQFRSQIVHKATQFLREENASVEDICAALLSLHLIDSRPLSETLSVLLSQRLKTIQTKLSAKKNTPLQNPVSRKTNGYTMEQQPLSKSMSDIKDAVHAPLEILFRTIKAAQKIFQDDGSHPPLICRVLQYIQSDALNPPEHVHTLPKGLCLTTQSLLATLPSSSHFQLLPQPLRSYRPHVDLTAPSTSIDQAHFHQKMIEWFRQATSIVQPAVKYWFAELQTIKAVWGLRTSTKAWILGTALDKDALAKLTVVLDEVCQCRVHEIWKHHLDEGFQSFVDQLDSSLSSLNDVSATPKYPSPAHFLFQAPPLPTASQLTLSSIDSSFQTYKASLRSQIIGRTTLLNNVLTALESCARTTREDLHCVMLGGRDACEFAGQLEGSYKDDADRLCVRVVNKLEEVAKSLPRGPVTLIFLVRVADELLSSSTFILDIGCQSSVAEGFRMRLSAVCDDVLSRWRKKTTSQIAEAHYLSRYDSFQISEKPTLPSGPSSNLVRSLLSLSAALRERGPRHRSRDFVRTTLREFIVELTDERWIQHGTQALCDLAFVQKLLHLGNDDREHNNDDLSDSLRSRVKANLPEGVRIEEVEKVVSDSIVRMQNLISTLLPLHPILPPDGAERRPALLPYGQPPISDSQFQPAIELAKPPPRFGLLLVS